MGGAGAVYHCLSRVVDRRFILGDAEKLRFLSILRKLEQFSGVRVLTYCLMDNHFHLLLQVPERHKLTPEEILDRLRALYGAWKWREELQVIEGLRSSGVSEARVVDYLGKYTRRMYDLSSFMRELKQRFTQWYNRSRKRKGTLWEDRYKSVLVESKAEALLTMAHYIDLNPVRAGLCEDPKDYRWSGYGAALGGERRAREGIRMLFGALAFREQRVSQLLQRYRVGLADDGVERCDLTGKVRRKGFDREKVKRILAENGRLSRSELLRCRVRYLSDGVVLGSREFVNEVFKGGMDFFGPNRTEAGRAMRGGDWQGLHTVRDLRLDNLSIPPPQRA